MDIVNLIISLISGGAGGNIVGAALKEKNLGPLINTVLGLIGGGAGNYIAQALDLFTKVATTAQASGIDIGQLLGNIGISGVSGAALVGIATMIKNAIDKPAA